jgi:TatD DNase family protein
MTLIDTHTHLYLDEFNTDLEAVMDRAFGAGVESFYLPAIDSTENEALLSLEKKYPGKVHAMAGLHPCSVKENYLEELSLIEKQLDKRQFAALGETGLDFYWDKTFTEQQYKSLHRHAEWALHYNRPIVLHTRNATQQTINVIKPYAARGLRGIFHCFGGNATEAKEIVGLGFALGIGGVITFKNAGLQQALADIELEDLVLETDAPYLSPAPYRGKRNESSYLPYIVQKLAEIKNKDVREVAFITTNNAKRIFS